MNRSLVARVSFALAAAFAVGLGAQPLPVEAQQSRFRVLVPNFIPQEGAKKDFGEDLAKELRELISDMPTHSAAEDRDVRQALRRYDLKAEDMNCIQWRQLAVQMQLEMVGCGTYKALGGDTREVSASFQGAKSGEPFHVEAFTATDPEDAAQRIFTDFEVYVNQLRLAVFCLQYLQSQQWDNALENCNKAIELNPNSTTALYGRAEALMKKAEALESGDNGEGPVGPGADTIAVPDVDAIAASGDQEHSAEYLQLMQQALEGFDAVLELNPIDERALTAAGYVAAKLGQPETARSYYERLIELDPDNVDVRLQLALDLARAGDPLGGLKIAEEGIERDPENIVLKEYAGHLAMGSAQHMASQAENATPMFSKALDYYRAVFEAKGAEAEPTMLRNMLATLNQLQRYEEAAELGARVSAVSRNPQVWLVYAEALSNVGQTEQALAALDTVIAIEPTTPGVTRRQAQWLLQRGQLARARELFQEAVQKQELTGDQVANLLFAQGYVEKCNRDASCEAGLEYYAMAREFATSEKLTGMMHFFTGYALLKRAERIQAPSTAASARESLPVFQQALQHFRNAAAYTDQESTRQQLISQTNQFIEVQEALIKRGR